jgi:ethylmalonyl-CoA mutase
MRNMADRPWVMRTYAGHSTAKKSNELYRTNLAKGQTGLSIAFDLPTQIGYDPDAPQAKGEVGKVGVPVAHLGHMKQLLDGLPVDQVTTSMTINATAAWLLALYIADGEEKGYDAKTLGGTTQNDIVKEYLSRGTFIYPPQPSKKLIVDTIAYTVKHVPKWNPINVCSYHLQEAGATPVQELAYSMATAVGVLDAVRESGQVAEDDFAEVVGRISFFCNAGIRFVEETCKMRAFTQWWDQLCRDRYGVDDPKLRRFRYGVQVNSLGLTEAQPENNVQRIVLEMLGVTLSKDARARAIQLPAWNEALGLPHPWDQQWALRMQQVLAFETDLLEYDDIFAGSHVIEKKTSELLEAARAEFDDVMELGGAFDAIDEVKTRLVKSQAERQGRIESGELKVVGVNCYTETAPSPLEGDEAILRVDPAVEAELIADVEQWRRDRDNAAVTKALDELKRVAEAGENVMPASIALAHAGGTTGEWANALREVFGEYRTADGRRRCGRQPGHDDGVGSREGERDLRRPAATARREAGSRRPLQRRRAGRRRSARRRLRGRLPGHSAHAGADRGRSPRRGRRHRRHLDPVRQPPAARARSGAPAAGGRRRRSRGGRRDHPDGRSGQTARCGRRSDLHAEGLRAPVDHGRHGGSRRRTPERRHLTSLGLIFGRSRPMVTHIWIAVLFRGSSAAWRAAHLA